MKGHGNGESDVGSGDHADSHSPSNHAFALGIAVGDQ